MFMPQSMESQPPFGSYESNQLDLKETPPEESIRSTLTISPNEMQLVYDVQ